MNFLSIFVLIPLLMLAGLWAARGIKAIRGVMVTGASALLIASVVLTFLYLGERSAGNTAEMLFRADTLWYAPLHISYSVGVDGISVAMLLLSAVIVFTGTFASWRLQPLTKEYFLWFTLLSMGVFGFFNFLAWATNTTSDEIRGLQSGQVQQYAYVFLCGALALILLLIL